MDQQAAIYRVEGVDENAPAAQPKKKRKANNDEVWHVHPRKGPCAKVS